MSVEIRYNPPMPTLYPECEGPYVVWARDGAGHLQPHSVASFDRAVDLYLSDTLHYVAIMEVVPIHVSDARQTAQEHAPGVNGRTVTVGLDGSGKIVHAALNRFRKRAEIEQKIITWIAGGLIVKQMKLADMPDDYPKSRIEFLNE